MTGDTIDPGSVVERIDRLAVALTGHSHSTLRFRRSVEGRQSTTRAVALESWTRVSCAGSTRFTPSTAEAKSSSTGDVGDGWGFIRWDGSNSSSVLLWDDPVENAGRVRGHRDALITSQGTIYGFVETTLNKFVVVDAVSGQVLFQAGDRINATANLSFLSFVPGALEGDPMIYTGGEPVSVFEVGSSGLTQIWIPGQAARKIQRTATCPVRSARRLVYCSGIGPLPSNSHVGNIGRIPFDIERATVFVLRARLDRGLVRRRQLLRLKRHRAAGLSSRVGRSSQARLDPGQTGTRACQLWRYEPHTFSGRRPLRRSVLGRRHRQRDCRDDSGRVMANIQFLTATAARFFSKTVPGERWHCLTRPSLRGNHRVDRRPAGRRKQALRVVLHVCWGIDNCGVRRQHLGTTCANWGYHAKRRRDLLDRAGFRRQPPRQTWHSS